jgi:hypothetical protein
MTPSRDTNSETTTLLMGLPPCVPSGPVPACTFHTNETDADRQLGRNFSGKDHSVPMALIEGAARSTDSLELGPSITGTGTNPQIRQGRWPSGATACGEDEPFSGSPWLWKHVDVCREHAGER